MSSSPKPSTPGKGAAGIGIQGAKPPSRAGTAAPGTARIPTASGTPRTARTSAGNADAVGALAQKLILKLRGKFGDCAADVKGQEIISHEVLAFVKRGVSIKEEDLTTLEYRIRQRLTGSTPVTNTLAQDKKAQMEGDEWAKIFQYSIAEGQEKDRLERIALKQRQERTRAELAAQMKERDDAKIAEQREEMEYARQEQAALKVWEAAEAERRRLQHDIAVKLRQERQEQLEEKTMRKNNALARVRAEDDVMASRIAYETRSEFEKEEAQRLEAKTALRDFMAKNEENKAIKAAMKQAQAEEDAYYQQAWRDVLDKQDRERTERLQRNMNRQAKTAEFANSGKLPEYKKWIDPAITEKHFRAREEMLDRLQREKQERIHTQGIATALVLKEQMVERDVRRSTVRLEDEAKAQMELQRAQAEETREQNKKMGREMAKLKFRIDLEGQMKENVQRKRNQPISEVERAINKELLSKVGAWKQTGRINIAA